MRISNWIVYGILTVISVVLLAAWHVTGASAVDAPLDLILTVVWWALIVGGGIAIWRTDVNRRRRERRAER